ncbi:SMP-30/gluconolactonase/LRE family protein [Lacibacter sediminis]|uniref:SMP-30/gluconolactonase/LRE family protein n=1 Tax=Lacibacter sediminis TaxID=2760713 RepID=A0A7G5XDE1_9BACT|nr:SMP-30/gluconolactonase/LRE family protein [Lacibacter sediminis]QNA43494.1 SMP-30/gluconolactonase/LRE family protein [Lacibacter sediminis]
MSKIYQIIKIQVILFLLLLIGIAVFSQETRQLAVDKPFAVADLKTTDGAALLNAKWFEQPAHIVGTAFKQPGPGINGDHLKLYPTGAVIQTNQLHPQIGAVDFENGFKSIAASELESRRGTGLFSFVWYKVELTIPTSIGTTSTKDMTAVFEITVDDYSEIWVNGKQQQSFGQSGNGVIAGYNTRNRVVLTNHATEGDKFVIYILGINGAIGKLPDNYIWVRNAVVDFYKNGLPVKKEWADIGKIYTINPHLNKIIAEGTKVEKVADGFSFTEGPVWHPDGFLLFSDPNTNTIYRYDPSTHNVTVYMSHSGYSGSDIGEYGQPGSNGLAIDKEGRLIVAQHGHRRIVRHEKKGPVTILADKIGEKRFNSPNDVVLKSDGTVYFTDPPYGLPSFYTDKRKETEWQGIYMIRNGKVQLVSKDLGGPNGLAFSPDEKYFYATNWDIRDIHNTKTIWRYEVQPDGTLKNGKVFFDFNFTEDEEALDGLKIDKEGNLFVSAPGGLWVLSSEAKILGKVVTPERPANMAWGDDGKTLYMTAHSSIYKLRVNTGGKLSWE